MSKHTGKGAHKRREAALTRKATQHHEFVGEAEPERAEAEFRKHERVESERNQQAVREMASELEELAGTGSDGSLGPELPFRVPRSVDEGRRMVREAPAALREKARERLGRLPEPAQKAARLAQDAAGLLFLPLRLGWSVAREVLRAPMAMIRVLRNREA